MAENSRREFLKACAAAGLAVHHAGLAAAAMARPSPAVLSQWVDPLPIPATLRPEKESERASFYRIPMVECEHRLHPSLPATRVWAYNGQYPGPVVEAHAGREVVIEWQNRLPARHLFAIDPHLHGCMAPSPAVRTVPHLHGARTDSASDGLPENWFPPGSSAVYRYPNQQPAATLWYHDHAVGITRLNAYAGLAGFYLLRDQAEAALELPAGPYEIPLMLQDRTVDGAGQLVYAPTDDAGTPLPPGTWGPHFFGELPVINGAAFPYLDVEPRLYRFRIVNGANGRFFHLYLNLAKSPTDIPALLTLQQIGSDGGLLPRPAKLGKLLLAPGERADVLLDFSGLEGRTLTLSNDAPSPYPGWGMLGMAFPPLPELMQFRVVRPLATGARAWSLPASLPFAEPAPPPASIPTRDFVLTEALDANGKSLGTFINGKRYHDPVTETVRLGSVEKWRFLNASDDAHPMHLHLVQFRVVERQGFEPAALPAETRLVGRPRPPAANESGWKDTAVVNPKEALTVLVRFEGFAGRFVYHCHMLEHEDNDMMRPFEVVSG